MLIHNAEVTGSLLVNGIPYNTGSFSGSFLGTISTASYVEYNNVANKPALLSGSAQVAAFGFATTGSNQFNGNQTVTGSLTVTGQVIAQTLNVQQVTSSIIYSSGSNVFGNSLANTQQFTGSVSITGSMNVNGTAQIQNQLRLNSTITNGTHTYTLPSATGTLALVSSLHNPVTLGTANGLSLSTQVLSLGLSSASTNGALSSTDWTTFNNKVSTSTLASYVTLSTAQTINATKTFSISTVSDGILIDNTSGRGIRINNNSTGFGLIINNGTTATATPITIQKSGNNVLTINDSGNITANSFIGPLTGNATTVTNGVYTTGNQTIGGTKTFSSAVVLSTAGTLTTHAVRADRSLTGGDGILIAGVSTAQNLTANRTITVDSTVIRTTGNQSMSGEKTFTGRIIRSGLTTATSAEDIFISRTGAGVDTFTRGALIALNNSTDATSAYLQNAGSIAPFQLWTFAAGFSVKMIQIQHNGLIALSGPVDVSGILQPGSDNTRTLGASGRRWSQVWAATGTIQTSDEREKTEIENTDLGLDFVQKLRPVSYKWKVGENIVEKTFEKNEDGSDKEIITVTPRVGVRKHYGLIAQEVKEQLDGKDFGGYIHDTETDSIGLRYDQFIPILIKSVQEQQGIIEDLQNQINELKK